MSSTPHINDAGYFDGSSLRRRPCQCDSCRKRRGEGPSEAQSFIARVFKLPTVQEIVDREGRELGDAIDKWVAAMIKEEETTQR